MTKTFEPLPGCDGQRRQRRWPNYLWLVLALLFATPAAAQTSAFETALSLAAQNRVEEALTVLSRWTPKTPGELEQKLWGQAVLFRQLGRPNDALPVLEDLVARRPDVPRFRTALGEVLQETGQTDRAKVHLEGGLGVAISEADEARRQRGLGALIAPQNWSGYFGLSLVPDSNPGQKTSATIVMIGGAPFVIAPAARKSGALGVNVAAGLTYAPKLSERASLRFGLSGDADLYDGSSPDDIRLRAQAALSYAVAPNTLVEGGVTYSRRYIGGSGYNQGPGLSFGLVHAPDRQSRVEVVAVVDWLKHDTLPGLDGTSSLAVLSYARVVTPQLQLRGSARIERMDTTAASTSATGYGIGVGGTYFFKGGLQMGLDLSLKTTGFDGVSPLFGTQRHDYSGTATLRLSHSQIQMRGFAPVIEFQYEERRSNISVYSYDGLAAKISLTRRF